MAPYYPYHPRGLVVATTLSMRTADYYTCSSLGSPRLSVQGVFFLIIIILFRGILFTIKWKHSPGCMKELVYTTIFAFSSK